MAAEFFDDKLRSIGYALFGVLETRNLTYDEFVFLEFATNVAAFDSTIAIFFKLVFYSEIAPLNNVLPYRIRQHRRRHHCLSICIPLINTTCLPILQLQVQIVAQSIVIHRLCTAWRCIV